MPRMEKLKDLFNVPAHDAVQVEVRDPVGPVPGISQHYVFDPILIKKLMTWVGVRAPRKGLMLMGNAGVGKTSLINEFAGRMGIPVWSISCSGKTRFEHLVGSMALVNGNTQWVDGPLTAAMRNGGVFLGNEITRMDAGEQMRLVDVLDRGGRLVIGDTGEILTPHPLFRIAATGNSGGFGDETGSYAGERVGSYAFGDRFMKLVIKPLEADVEEALVKTVAPALSDLVCKGMVQLARSVRSQFVGNGGRLRITISPRSLIDWALLASEYRAMKGIEPIREALFDTVLNGAPQESVTVVTELFDQWIQPGTV